MGTEQNTPFHRAEKTMKTQHKGQKTPTAQLLHNSKHRRIAYKLPTEGVKRLQTLLSLLYKSGIILKRTHSNGSVYVENGYARLSHSLAKENVLVAITPKPLVKGMGKRYLTADKEIGGAKTVIRPALPLLHTMGGHGMLLIEITQAGTLGEKRLADPHTAIDNAVACGDGEIAGEIVGTYYAGIAVDKQQPVVVGLTDEEVAYCRTTHILSPLHITAMAHGINDEVVDDKSGIGGTVVCHYYLVAERRHGTRQTLRLFTQIGDEAGTAAIERRYQDRQRDALFHRFILEAATKLAQKNIKRLMLYK